MQKFTSPLFFCLLLARAAYPQDQALERPANEYAEIVENDKISIDINLGKEKYPGLEPIPLNIVIKNTGKDVWRFHPTQPQFFYNIEIVGPDKQAVPLLAISTIQRGDSGEPMALRPGEARAATVWINYFFDISSLGKYQVKVTKKFRLKDEDKKTFIISSKTIPFEITSAPIVSTWR